MLILGQVRLSKDWKCPAGFVARMDGQSTGTALHKTYF